MIKSYGLWESPVTADLIVKGAVRLGNIEIDGDFIYWNEVRPSEQGRSVICRQAPGRAIEEVTGSNINVRTRVHEYGGGAFTVSDGIVYFVNDFDQRVYSRPVGDEVRKTPFLATCISPEGIHFADLQVTDHGIVGVAEVERDDAEPENYLALINPDTGTCTRLASGCDFYASPTVDPTSNRLAWLTWNHPNLPWDGTDLWVADLSKDGLANIVHVAGSESESIFQPQWAADGSLVFVSDRNGWGNLYRYDGKGVAVICDMQAEFGLPQWVFRMSTWAFAGDQIISAYSKDGVWRLAGIDVSTGEKDEFDLGYTFFDQVRASGDTCAFIAAAPDSELSIVRLELANGKREVIRRSSDQEVNSDYISVPEPVSFPSGDRTAHAFLYKPVNPDFSAPDGELPPLIVKSHGGPTAATEACLSWKIQYWTTRGFAVLDVNYGGSTGYGRAYRELLNKNWGVIDVEDCSAGAQWLAEQGIVDADRLAITGGSAGGFTTLACLAFKDVFSVGASYYGVGDLAMLARDTHKFESRYLDRLVGPYPEAEAIYNERSPLRNADAISCPVIFFQGLEDKIVPPNQAEEMVAALKAKGLKVEYVPYEGEQHGFRRAENIKDSLERELAFYLEVFGD